MPNVMRVSGASLTKFMISFRQAVLVEQKKESHPTKVAIESYSDRLELHPEGIPINLAHKNGLLESDWFEEMVKLDPAFRHPDSHWHLTGTDLDGRHSGEGKLGCRDEWSFTNQDQVPLDITFEKKNFPTKEQLFKKCKMGELALIERLYKDSAFLQTKNADPLLNSEIWHLGNRGIWNTTMSLSWHTPNVTTRYHDFVIDDMCWLTDNELFPFGSELNFHRSIFPVQISAFLETLDKAMRPKAGTRSGFHFELHFMRETLEYLKKGQRPEKFVLLIYFHNSEDYNWQIGLWI